MMTMTEKLLRRLEIMPMRFRDIQRFLYGLSRPGDPRDPPRGWWCARLMGSTWTHHGVLNVFCVKLPDGRWQLYEPLPRPWPRRLNLYAETEASLMNEYRRHRIRRKSEERRAARFDEACEHVIDSHGETLKKLADCSPNMEMNHSAGHLS